MKTIKTLLCGLAALLTGLAAHAAVPSTITKFVPDMMNYQGYLANPSTGEAYTDGIYQLECRLYRTASGGTAIWGAVYSVYVNGGYFNIMLGDSSGASVPDVVNGSGSTIYGVTDLWKALWYDSAASEKNNLWLGVTPLQGPTGAAVSSKVEIQPRQQLLCAPYAFRAQSAQYAAEAQGDFKVNGKLTVAGSLSLPSSFSLGNNLTLSSNKVQLGGSASTQQASSSSNPDLYAYANNIYSYAYNNIFLRSSYGNITLSTPSSKSFLFSTGNFAVTNSTKVSLSSGSYANLELDNSANAAKLAGYYTTVTGAYTYVKAKYDITLQPATNSSVYGQGRVRWKSGANGSGTSLAPIVFIKQTIDVNSGVSYGIKTLTTFEGVPGVTYNCKWYNWSVVGIWQTVSGGGADYGLREWRAKLSNDTLTISIGLSKVLASGQYTTYDVYLMGVLKEWSSDMR